MYVGLKQPREDGERYVTPARAAAKETTILVELKFKTLIFQQRGKSEYQQQKHFNKGDNQ